MLSTLTHVTCLLGHPLENVTNREKDVDKDAGVGKSVDLITVDLITEVMQNLMEGHHRTTHHKQEATA